MNTSKILAALPPLGEAFYLKHTHFIHKLIRLNLTTENEVLSTIWILCEELRLTLPELAKEIGVRKIDGVWHAVDPCGHAVSLSDLEKRGFDVVDERENYTEESQIDLPDGVITSTRELSTKLHITMRRAQQIYKAKLVDLAAGQDLFGLGVQL